MKVHTFPIISYHKAINQIFFTSIHPYQKSVHLTLRYMIMLEYFLEAQLIFSTRALLLTDISAWSANVRICYD